MESTIRQHIYAHDINDILHDEILKHPESLKGYAHVTINQPGQAPQVVRYDRRNLLYTTIESRDPVMVKVFGKHIISLDQFISTYIVE